MSELRLPPGMGLVEGDFGNGRHCLTSLVEGDFWCARAAERRLVYRDDGAGNFDDCMPCNSADAATGNLVLDNQSLAPAFTDTDCKLLLRFDGADGATAVIDSSPSTKSIAAAGSFELDDANKKFGATSGLFTTASDVLTVTDHDDFALGAAWTIEAWVYSSTTPSFSIWRQYLNVNYYIIFNITNGVVRCFFNNGGIAPYPCSIEGTTPVTTGEWHHVAFTFDGTSLRLFLDGQLENTDTVDYTVPNWAANPTVNYNGLLRGWLDGVALFNVCKYTAAFTPPTQPHGDTKVWQFKQAGVSSRGSIGDLSDALAIEVDAAGQVVGPVGNNASELTATPGAAGVIDLAWEYDRTDEAATPTGFKVYRKIASVWTLQDTVALTENRLRYDPNVSQQAWTSGAFAHSTSTEWQVRTYKTIGGTDYERLADAPEASATADDQGPTAVTELTLVVPG